MSEHYGLHHCFDTYDNGLENDPEEILRTVSGGVARWGVRANQRRSDETAEAAIRWLNEQRDGPFFVWIHFWDPHDRFVLPTQEILERFNSEEGRYSDATVNTYDAELAFVDENFGRVIDVLKATGEYDRTIIVVISDHGEGLGDHGWQTHHLLYQEQIRVPLIIKLPDSVGGKRVSNLVRSIDIFPTILEQLGIELPTLDEGAVALDGRSLMKLIKGEKDEPRMAYADQLNRWDSNAPPARRRPLDALIYCAMDDN